MSTPVTTAPHEFCEPSSQADICHAAIYPDDICGQSRDAAIHRPNPDYIVTVAPDGVSVRDAIHRTETPAERCPKTAGEQHCGHCDGLLVWGFDSYVHADPKTECLAFGGRQSEPASEDAASGTVADETDEMWQETRDAAYAAPEAEGAPPERLWLERREIYGINVWIESTPDDGIEYIEKSAHDKELARLREALRRMAGNYHVAQKHGNGLVIGPFRDCDNPECTAARKELEGTK